MSDLPRSISKCPLGWGLEQATSPSEIAHHTFNQKLGAVMDPEICVIAGCFGDKSQWNGFEELRIVYHEHPVGSLIPKAGRGHLLNFIV
jgi:hypothetical protein